MSQDRLPAVGFLNLLKPPGLTSHDVVDIVRRRLPRKHKVGHLGTLDPAATGVLPLALGSATRLIPLLPDLGSRMKAYHALIQLGVTTTSDDLEGEVVERWEGAAVTPEALKVALEAFRGTISQVPPQVSAVRKDGERAYHKARRGEAVELDARTVTLARCELQNFDPLSQQLSLFLVCSTGTYVRSLARDLGRALGVGGALAFLIRTHSGPFELEQAVTLEDLRQGPLGSHLVADDFPFRDLPLVEGLRVESKGQVVEGDFPKVPRFRCHTGLLCALEEPGRAKVEALFRSNAS